LLLNPWAGKPMVGLTMRPIRTSARDDGYLLIEVIMGAVLVLLVTLGLLSGFDSSTRASSINKQRSEASSIAQTDQESLRTLPVASLSNYHGTKTVTVAGVAYTVAESAVWVNDNSGVINCTNASTAANYIEINSSVTWAGMGITPPVSAQSLVSPPVGTFGPNQGTAVVQITDGQTTVAHPNGVPVAGVTVSLGGPGAFHDITDANGCAVFGYIPAGSYTISASRGGWVDQEGNSPGQQTCDVPSDGTKICQMAFNQAGTIPVTVQTQPYHATWTPATATSIEVSNQIMTPVPFRNFPATPSATYLSSITASNLFPFPSGYGIYSGSCAQDDPRVNPISNSGYFTNNPGQVAIGPGGTQSVLIDEPSINLTVLNVGGGLQAGALVHFTDIGCSPAVALPVQTTLSTGHIPNPGLPFGTYSVWATFGGKRTSCTLPTVVNQNLAGTDLTIGMTQTGSTCP
jgi:hypothetical protein